MLRVDDDDIESPYNIVPDTFFKSSCGVRAKSHTRLG